MAPLIRLLVTLQRTAPAQAALLETGSLSLVDPIKIAPEEKEVI